MTLMQTPDFLSSIRLMSQQTLIKSRLSLAGREMTTGEKGRDTISGSQNLSRIFDVERKLRILGADVDALKVAAGKADLVQLGLSRIGDGLSSFSSKVISGAPNTGAAILTASRAAKEELSAAMSALNSKYGRHAVFSGAAIDRNAVASADVLLADISAIIAGAGSAAAAISQIDTYFFDPAGGYATSIYLGSQSSAPASVLSDGQRYETPVRADSEEIRQSLRALALGFAAGVTSGTMGLDEKKLLLEEAGIAAIRAGDAMVDVRGAIGSSEESINRRMVATQSQQIATELERSNLRGVDPYEAAVRVEALQLQLQSVYTLTARLADLSLTKYMR